MGFRKASLLNGFSVSRATVPGSVALAFSIGYGTNSRSCPRKAISLGAGGSLTRTFIVGPTILRDGLTDMNARPTRSGIIVTLDRASNAFTCASATGGKF